MSHTHIRNVLLALALLLPGVASAGQIDYFFNFASAAAAQSDAYLVADYLNSAGYVGWRQDIVFSDIQVWRPAQDVNLGNDPQTGRPIFQHQYLGGYYIMASLPSPFIPAALNHAKIVVVIDRDTNTVLKNNTGSLAALNALQFSPVPAGSNYPFGAFQ